MSDEAAQACKTGCCGGAESIHSRRSAESGHDGEKSALPGNTGCCGGEVSTESKVQTSQSGTEKDNEKASPCKTGCCDDAASVSSKLTSGTSTSMYCDESQKCDGMSDTST